MNKMLTVCCLLCLFAAGSLAVAKVDPNTGATSDGTSSPTFLNADRDLILAERDRMESDLAALYQEAISRKAAGQEADEI